MNVGTVDRIIRAIVGLVLIVLPFASKLGLPSLALFGQWGWVAASVVVGLVLLGTAAVKTCPLYSVLGLRT